MEQDQLKTKFIEGTNNQYSIRNDGEVIMHYKLTWKGNKTAISVDKIMRKYCNTYVTISKEGKNICLVINTLLIKYFNYKLCTKCGSIKSALNHICDSCKKEATKEYNKKSRHLYEAQKSVYQKKYCHTEKYKLKQLERSKTEAYKATRKKLNDKAKAKALEELPKWLVAKYLNLKAEDLCDKYYEASKINILLKRKLKQLQNG